MTTKVFKTKTLTNYLKINNPDVEVVIDGEEGLELLKELVMKSWGQGRDFELQCSKLKFQKSK